MLESEKIKNFSTVQKWLETYIFKVIKIIAFSDIVEPERENIPIHYPRQFQFSPYTSFLSPKCEFRSDFLNPPIQPSSDSEPVK